MPRTKLASKMATKAPNYEGFQKVIKKRMIDQDVWYQSVSAGLSDQTLRRNVSNPGRFRMEDLVTFLKALQYSHEEIAQIIAGLAIEMAGGSYVWE